MLKTPDLVIFVTTTAMMTDDRQTKPISLPLAHACGIITNNCHEMGSLQSLDWNGWNGMVESQIQQKKKRSRGHNSVPFKYLPSLVGNEGPTRLKETAPVLATWLIVNSKAVKVLYPIVVKFIASSC